MQRYLNRVIVVAAAALAVSFLPIAGVQSASAETLMPAGVGVNVDVGFFYDRLAPHGEWVRRDPYGWSWHPYSVAVDWRPYTIGNWVYDDDSGWMWASDEPWGWATYHYGRWFWDDDYGWMWVPGTEWAPAWVAWRYGDGYVGWCPLTPEIGWSAGIGLRWGSFSLGVSIGHPRWSFVRDRDFYSPHIHNYLIVSARNQTLFGRTHDITNFAFDKDHVVNRSLKVEDVERFTGHAVERVHIRDHESIESMSQAKHEDHQVDAYRPRFAEGDGGHQPPHIESERDRMSAEELRQHHETEAKSLSERQEADRKALDEEHRRELQSPPSRSSAEELRKQHETERNIQQEQHRQQHEFQQKVHERDNNRGGRKTR